MQHQTIIRCLACEQVYIVREGDDGEYILTTEDGSCNCGDDAFREVRKTVED